MATRTTLKTSSRRRRRRRHKDVVILIPSQGGSDLSSFYWSGDALKRYIYGGRAQIIRSYIDLPPNHNPERDTRKQYPIRFFNLRGRPFSFRTQAGRLNRVITLSHGTSQDGPNMTHGVGGYQPWPVYDPLGIEPHNRNRFTIKYHPTTHLNNDDAPGGVEIVKGPLKQWTIDMMMPHARSFWADVGRALAERGKIILLGCNMAFADVARGEMSYAQHVANASGRTTISSTKQFAAADVKTSLKHVRQIERGVILPPLTTLKPMTR